jgi:peptidoglycan/LPS O-acetylase OafA/YrhL
MSGIAQLKRAIGVAQKSSQTTKPRAKKGLRKDVQGLRAFAVIVVILDHLMHWPTGGFVGVDIFFVISGFVITQSLLREHARTGSISLRAFYKRRVKRILPASILTLVFTLAAAYVAFGQSRFVTTLWDTVWAMLFSANWRFASVGTDYFQAAGPVSPIQHFWSLAVEEQFYFVWPFLMLAVFGIFSRRGKSDRGARFIVGVLICAIIVGSFAWAMRETATAPTIAYFSTASRAWELGVGALLAIAAPTCARIPAILRPILAWAGVTGMVASLIVINTATPFPAPAAALPVLSAALFIAAGSGSAGQRFLLPFTNPVSNYIGDMSYSLYLWHFPIIIIAGTFLDTESLPVQLAVLGVVLLWSYYMYVLWEKRILDSTWLTGNPRPGSSKDGTVFSEGYKLTALSLLAVLAAGLAFMAVQPAKLPDAVALPSIPAATTSASAAAAPALGPELTKVQAQLTAALKSPTWPELTPTLDNVIETDPVPADVGPCGGTTPPPASVCTWGNSAAPKSAILIGDSVAQTYIPALQKIYGTGDWKLRGMSMYGCRSLDLTFETPSADQAAACEQRKEAAVDVVNSVKPDMVIVINSYYMAANLQGTDRRASATEWKTAMNSYLSKMTGSGAKIVIVTPPPADKNPSICATKQSTPASCVGTITTDWHAIAQADSDVVMGLKGAFVDSSKLFCAQSYCPAFSGSLPIKRDTTHMIPDYALTIVPALREILTAAGV